MSVHSVKRANAHLTWDNSIPPAIHVSSGDTITFDCLDASNGQLSPDSTKSALATIVFAELNQVNGPVHVAGAMPGDTLQVELLSVEIGDWGWTAFIPGFGLLPDEFPEPTLKIWMLDKQAGYTWFDEARGIRIPLRPFPGEMGLARGVDGAFSTLPPYNTGGNMDTKYLTAGSTLFLPVEVPGALFSIGDGHAAQGDGEVCGSAIETAMKVKVRLTVRKDKPYVTMPQYNTPPTSSATATQHPASEEYYCTTGIDSDPREATRAAVRHMITFLGAEHGIPAVDAYILCSVSGDLRLHEVVDMPNYVVGMMLPKSIFVK